MTWTTRAISTTNISIVDISSVSYGAGTFVAVGLYGSIYGSTTGIDWVTCNNPVPIWTDTQTGNTQSRFYRAVLLP